MVLGSSTSPNRANALARHNHPTGGRTNPSRPNSPGHRATTGSDDDSTCGYGVAAADCKPSVDPVNFADLGKILNTPMYNPLKRSAGLLMWGIAGGLGAAAVPGAASAAGWLLRTTGSLLRGPVLGVSLSFGSQAITDGAVTEGTITAQEYALEESVDGLAHELEEASEVDYESNLDAGAQTIGSTSP